MTLKEQLKKALNLPESMFSNHCSDLQVLGNGRVINWLKENYEFYQNVERHISNVKGQNWFGQMYLEIPFAYEEYYFLKPLRKKCNELARKKFNELT